MSPDASPIAPSSIARASSARIVASSSRLGARAAPPITHFRSVPWPTNEVRLIAGRASSQASAYWAKVVQVRRASRTASDRSSSSAARPLTGADEPPQFPHTTSVTPMCRALSNASFTKTLLSECEWMSMKPGATTRSRASIIRVARRPAASPTSVMRPAVIATSARTPGAPVPSMTTPPRMRRSVTPGALGRRHARAASRR